MCIVSCPGVNVLVLLDYCDLLMLDSCGSDCFTFHLTCVLWVATKLCIHSLT